MQLVVCLIAFGDAETFHYRFKNFFDNPKINYIIHYNKRDYQEFLKLKEREIFNQKNIYFFSEIEVFWGDISILDAQLLCIKKANQIFNDYTNLIILDNKSLPCRNWDYIIDKIENFNGNWFNYNKKIYPKNYYDGYKWILQDELFTNITFNFDRPSDCKKGSWWITKFLKENFKYNLKINEKSFLKRIYFLTIINFSKNILFNKILSQKTSYFMSNKDIGYEWKKYNYFNIIGPNIILKKDQLSFLLESDDDLQLYNHLNKKHAPEEIYFSYLFEQNNSKQEIKNSKNAFLSLNNFTSKLNFINKKRILKLLKNEEDLLFLRRYATTKEIRWFKKNILNM
ncbi:MAG: beta-1,6-N-acetylglucosaminyltransferase [Metamycoplasmataceae bacterium]